MGCLKGSMTMQALGGVSSPCGWYCVRGQIPSTGGQDHTHTYLSTGVINRYRSIHYLTSTGLLRYLVRTLHHAIQLQHHKIELLAIVET
jgi:hypothetical protein